MTTAPTASRLLVVDDEPDLRTLYELTLLREGHAVETAAHVADALHALQEGRFDLVITDMRLPDGTGLDILKHLERDKRDEKVMVITAYGSAQSAVEALRAGAYDYLTKPVDLKQFRQAVSAALASRHHASGTLLSTTADTSSTTTGAPQGLPQTSPALSRLVGDSPAMAQVRGLIEKVARSMAPVRLWGESGTGKELVARAIHDVGVRSNSPFVAVNCSAIPEHLLEAEFFGFRKGAFTGANEDRNGFFQAAQGGTLFLDEIGDLPLSMQAKLLRVIQERAVRPLGAVSEMACDVRIISASHKDLDKEVSGGRFRQDLFYRINVILISLPPLRDRLSDLPLIADQLLRRITAESKLPQQPQLHPHALTALQQYPFPGNVRELENLLHRAVALGGHAHIEAADLGLPASALNESPGTPPLETTAWVNTESPNVFPIDLPADLATYLDTIERDILVRALEVHRLNRTAAGSSLGISLRQMRYRMERLGVQVTATGVVIGPSPSHPSSDSNDTP